MAVGFIAAAEADVLVCLGQDQDSFRYLVHIEAAGRFPFSVGALVPLLEGHLLDGYLHPSFYNLVFKDCRFTAAALETLFWFCHAYHLCFIYFP